MHGHTIIKDVSKLIVASLNFASAPRNVNIRYSTCGVVVWFSRQKIREIRYPSLKEKRGKNVLFRINLQQGLPNR